MKMINMKVILIFISAFFLSTNIHAEYSREQLLNLIDTSNFSLPDNNTISSVSLQYNPESALHVDTGSIKQLIPELNRFIPSQRGSYCGGETYDQDHFVPDEGIQFAESQEFCYVWDSVESQIFTILQKENTQTQPINPNLSMTQASQDLIQTILNIPSAEVGAPQEFDLFKQEIVEVERPNSEPTLDLKNPTLAAHKIFFERLVNGVPVVGNRVVTTFNPDRSLKKVYGVWPGLSQKNHYLTTDKTTEDIKNLIVDEIIFNGDNQRDYIKAIPIVASYEPNYDENGRVYLDLVVDATLDISRDGQNTNEKTKIYSLSLRDAETTPIIGLPGLLILGAILSMVSWRIVSLKRN